MTGTRRTGNLSRFEILFGPEGEAGRRIQLAIVMLSGIIIVGASDYVVLGWDFLDALYMTVITVGTIGFEDVNDLDEDPLGRVWTIILIISGVAVLGYATTSLVALAVEGTRCETTSEQADAGGDLQTRRSLHPLRLRSGRAPGGRGVRPRRRPVRRH